MCFQINVVLIYIYFKTDLIPGEKYDLRVLARTKQGWPNISESQLGWVTVTLPSSNDLTQAQIFIFNSTTIKVIDKHYDKLFFFRN